MIKFQKLKNYFVAVLATSIFLVFASLIFSSAQDVYAQDGASLYLSPTIGTFQTGSTFNISIFVNTAKKEINAVDVYLRFDQSKLQVVDPVAGNSFIEFWVAPPTFSNKDGTIFFRGGLPNPGIKGTNVLVSTITFRARVPGEAIISIEENSAVLANDARGTNILSHKSGGRYSIVIPPPEGPLIFSPTHPDPLLWSSNNSPVFEWEKNINVKDFSYVLDHISTTIPDNVDQGEDARASYTDITDGIWYFHVKARNKNNRWGGTSHYFIQVDALPPASFPLTLEPRGIISPDEIPVALFATTDSVSGLSHYEVRINSSEGKETGFFVETESPYRITGLGLGKYDIIVRAYDNAGNYIEEHSTLTIKGGVLFNINKDHIQIFSLKMPWWVVSPLFILILGALITLVHMVYHKKRFPPVIAGTIARMNRSKQITELKDEIEELKMEELGFIKHENIIKKIIYSLTSWIRK